MSGDIWFCKIGECEPHKVPHGGDFPMRQAVGDIYKELTGEEPKFIFSGWGGDLDEGERAVVENRNPVYEKTDYGQRQILEATLAEKDARIEELEELRDQSTIASMKLNLEKGKIEKQYHDLLAEAIRFAIMAQSDMITEGSAKQAQAFLARPEVKARMEKENQS